MDWAWFWNRDPNGDLQREIWNKTSTATLRFERRRRKQRLNSRNELLRADLRLGGRQSLCTRSHATESKNQTKASKAKQSKAKQDQSGNKNRTSTSRCQPAASSQDSLHPWCTTGRNETPQGTTEANDEQLGTTANNKEQWRTTRNNGEQRETMHYPSNSSRLSSAVALSLTSHSMATSASSSRSWMLCASRETSLLPTSIVGKRGIASWPSEKA